MTNCCVQCGKDGASRSFECAVCPSNEGQSIRFYVCNRACQRIFWKTHKKEHTQKEGTMKTTNATATTCSKSDDEKSLETLFGSVRIRECTEDDFMESLNNPRAWFYHWGIYRSAEWLVDCYRMRVNDDVEWGSMNYHGLYAIAYALEAFGGTKPFSNSEKASILVVDFLVFIKLAVVNEVMPENLDAFNFQLCVAHFAPNLLPFHFDKQDAKEKWGGENIFSPHPSLRRTAEIVYGLSCMSPYDDDAAQKKGEQTQQQVRDTVDRGVDKSDFTASSDSLFRDIGGKDTWLKLYKSLAERSL